MSENKNFLEKYGKIIHIASEVVLLSSITFYFARRCGNVEYRVEILEQKMLEQQQMIESLLSSQNKNSLKNNNIQNFSNKKYTNSPVNFREAVQTHFKKPQVEQKQKPTVSKETLDSEITEELNELNLKQPKEMFVIHIEKDSSSQPPNEVTIEEIQNEQPTIESNGEVNETKDEVQETANGESID